MIVLVKPSDYCANAMRYATEKAKAKIVKVNHMPENLSAISMWHRMKIHCLQHQDKHTRGRPMRYPMLTLVFSPSPEECRGWELEDWSKFYDEMLEAIDSVDISKEEGCEDCVPIHLVNSMSVGALHSDSKSGKLHLHADICRLDMDGNTNQLHQLHIRAMKAAEIINRRHGWTLPEDIREDRHQEVSQDCMDILRNMRHFNYSLYFDELRKKGYVVDVRWKDNKPVGYTVKSGASFFKASDLGTGRKLVASKLEMTWQKLHKNDAIQLCKPSPASVTPRSQDVFFDPSLRNRPVKYENRVPADDAKCREPKTPSTLFKVKVDNEVFDCNIPDTVKDVFANEAELPDDTLWSTAEDVTHTAMLLFCGYVDAATAMSQSLGGGGGGSETKNWGRDKDEDDWEFARRCLALAKTMHKRPKRSFHR